MASYAHSEERHRFSGPHGSDVPRFSIDEALSNKWLDVWYQPKIDLRRKCLAGAEALVRVHHPQAGLLWPEDYLAALVEDQRIFSGNVITSLDGVRRSGIWTSSFNQCARESASENSGQRARCGTSSAVGEMARADIRADRGSDRSRFAGDPADRQGIQDERHSP